MYQSFILILLQYAVYLQILEAFSRFVRLSTSFLQGLFHLEGKKSYFSKGMFKILVSILKCFLTNSVFKKCVDLQ